MKKEKRNIHRARLSSLNIPGNIDFFFPCNKSDQSGFDTLMVHVHSDIGIACSIRSIDVY